MTTKSEISESAPSLRYYRAVEGQWRAPLVFSARGSGSSSPRWWQRLRDGSTSLASKLIGQLMLETTVDATSRAHHGEVVHTTNVSKWGFTMYEAFETLALDPNGKDIAISRRERMAPSPFFRFEQGRSRAEVEASGTQAHYWFPIFGGELLQTVTIEGAGVRVVQTNSFLAR